MFAKLMVFSVFKMFKIFASDVYGFSTQKQSAMKALVFETKNVYAFKTIGQQEHTNELFQYSKAVFLLYKACSPRFRL